MPIAVVMDFVDATLSRHDRVGEAMGLAPGAPGAPGGCLFRWVTATEGGVRITDVWESADQFERFAIERIGPITDAVGVPWLTFYEVHGYLAAGSGASAADRPMRS